ncbi:hypothetical protein ScPMuIL_016161 [Solemya velum]
MPDSLLDLRQLRHAADDELALMKIICQVCGQRKCPRHRPELNILAFQPWTNLEVNDSVDQAVEEFLNIVMKNYVYTWYKDLSGDEEFVDELKTSLRFLASVVLRRLQRVDVAKLVTEKLLKAAVQHLDVYLQAKQSANPGSDLQEATLDYLDGYLHCAMQNRKTELEYLRRMVESLFPHLLRPQALQSRSMCALVREILSGTVLLPALDAIANPDMVNNFLLVFLDDTPPPPPTEPPTPKVSFLQNFDRPLSRNKSCLRVQMSEVMSRNCTQWLYPFMQFLKSEAAVNVLQFCLACEDFNQRILSPDLSQGELVELHQSAKDLYRNYCAQTALDRIKFDEDIVSELKDIVEGPTDLIIRLRTSTPLFKAYEHAFDLLETTFLPLFHQSHNYYAMICGGRVGSQTAKSVSKQPKKKEFGLSNLGSKLKEVFRTNTAETRSLPDMESMDETETAVCKSCSSLEDETMMPENYPPVEVHDLSSWRVTIPRIGARCEIENPKKEYFVFIVDIKRIDVSEESNTRTSWTVARRYAEFFVLEQKLSEFHGEFPDCQLPPKKTFGTKNYNFMDERRETFELYLQRLLTKPFLRGSQLLHNFLTSDNEFTTSILPDINIGKMFKAVPMKLVKEKGQHLEPFLQSFLSSTEATKPRPSKEERRGSDASFRSTSSEKLCGSLFENNANCSRDSADVTPTMEEFTEMEGIFDIILYLARYVYEIPQWFHHILCTARILLSSTLEAYLGWYIDQKVDQVTQEHRLVGLIHLLRDVVFFDSDPPRTDEQKKIRYEKTLKACLEFFPKPFVSVIGKASHRSGTKLLLDVLQQPKLNKQLSYVFLDLAIEELFPELN